MRTDFNRILLQVNGENNTDQVIAYIDDFNYEKTDSFTTIFKKLVWSDEFDSSGMVDNRKWFHQTKLPEAGSWYNGEIQHYTNRKENSLVENGILKIIAKKEWLPTKDLQNNILQQGKIQNLLLNMVGLSLEQNSQLEMELGQQYG